MDDDILRDAFGGGAGDEAAPTDGFADALEQRLRAAAAQPTVAVEMADVDDEVVAPGRRGRTGWRTAVAIGAAAALIGAVVVVRGATKSTKHTLTIAQIDQATNGTARIETHAEQRITGGHGTSFSVTSEGVVDFARHAARAETTGPQAAKTTSITVGGLEYESLESFRLPGVALPPGKRWLSFPARRSAVSDSSQSSTPSSSTATATSGGAIASSSTAVGFGGTDSDPSTVLDDLRKAGARLEALGAASVRGVAVQRYEVVYPASAHRVRSKDVIAVDDRGRLRRWTSEASLADVFGDVAAGDSTPTSVAESDAIQGTVRVETDFFDYGIPVEIDAPPANEVMTIEQLQQYSLEHQPCPSVALRGSRICIGAGPARLTTPWQAVLHGTHGIDWTVYRGEAADGTVCFAYEGAVSAAEASVASSAGVVDGKDAQCFARGTPHVALLAALYSDHVEMVGVAPSSGTVKLSGSGSWANEGTGEVFVYRGEPAAVPDQFSIVTPSTTVGCSAAGAKAHEAPQWSCITNHRGAGYSSSSGSGSSSASSSSNTVP